MSSSKTLISCVVVLLLLGAGAMIYKYWPAETKVGPPPEVGAGPLLIPFIFWGGDVATFHANGNLQTQPNSIYKKLNLDVNLTPGDDFDQQVKDYIDGKSAFLRGTMSMLGQVSDKLTGNSSAKPVVFLQLTWSAGDHLVGREAFATLNNLGKGKKTKIALQTRGPHVGMLNDILDTTKLAWSNIEVVWTDDLTGPKGPAEAFRKDPTIDACFVVTPDKDDLCDMAKGIKGAHVVVSTEHMSRSIADVYAVRKDFYEKNKEWVQKFAAGYIKGCEELVAAKKKAGEKWKEGAAGKDYQAMIKLSQEIWSKDKALKDLVKEPDDVNGLISDAMFAGLPGNQDFFTKKGNLSGFEHKMAMALKLPGDPAREGLKSNPRLFEDAKINYADLAKLGNLNGKPISGARFRAAEISDKDLVEQTIYSFEIPFQPDQATFPEKDYGKDFQRALEQASLFSNAVVAIRGHADIGNIVVGFEQAAPARGIVRSVGGDDYIVTADNSRMKLSDTAKLLKLVADNNLVANLPAGPQGGTRATPLQLIITNLRQLSDERAKAVQKAIETYAVSKSLVLDASQIRAKGVGVTDPANPVPHKDPKYNGENRRVVFSIIKVPADQVVNDLFGE
jgi:ABC-type nitrate/sulfonate/bicarbonate transport system substrate-binding protein